jgi:hypothetical protein
MSGGAVYREAGGDGGPTRAAAGGGGRKPSQRRRQGLSLEGRKKMMEEDYQVWAAAHNGTHQHPRAGPYHYFVGPAYETTCTNYRCRRSITTRPLPIWLRFLLMLTLSSTARIHAQAFHSPVREQPPPWT